ncbi:hypothetical protein L6452_31525 [Arctium lappa]|uniref:Uncharacterized protein n=1 Tax=Arctium lappa TaxID=4217 RepID=A0ACB8Z291_ARCLA|nr:hypothetical protein L6452_31525 [Arctium lappa]
MNGKVVVVSGIVAVIGIISAVAGFAAEATKVKIASVIAAILLLVGAALNSREGGQKDYDDTIACYVAKPGIFAHGCCALFFKCGFLGSLLTFLYLRQDEQPRNLILSSRWQAILI